MYIYILNLPAFLQILEGKLEKRIKNKYGPPLSKRMITFVDDLNMPRKDKFGSQPPLELLRYGKCKMSCVILDFL